MKVNEFLKALQGIGYGLEYDAGTRTLRYVAREPVLTNPSFIDFTGRYGEIEDIQNQPKGGLTLSHLEDNADTITGFPPDDAADGIKPFVIGDGRKIIQSGFHVPKVLDNTFFFPNTIGVPQIVVTRNMAASENFTLRLAFSNNTAFGGIPAMLIHGRDYSLSWFGPNGLTEQSWKYWKGLESGAPFIQIKLYMNESEAFAPFWKEKVLIDRNKYILRSFNFEIDGNDDLIECDAELVRADYSVRTI